MSKHMTHADALRAWAAQYATRTARAQFLAGADALDTLAADTLEYKVETLYNGHWREPSVYADYYWLDDYNWAVESLAAWQKEYPGEQFRIVARRVSAPWEVTDEH